MAVRKESASGTRILDSGDPPVIDRWGREWSLQRGGFIFLNGNLFDWGTKEIAYVEHYVWASDLEGRWYRWAGRDGPWTPEGGTLTPPFALADPTLVTLATQLEAGISEIRSDFSRVWAAIDALSSKEAVTDAKVDAILGMEGVSQETPLNWTLFWRGYAKIGSQLAWSSCSLASGQLMELIETWLRESKLTWSAYSR